ncbi:MAG: hypothetical protein WCS72_05345 [Deltaproteobacteria bacterium]
MTSASLAATLLVALLSGQSGSDPQAYALYQAKLAVLMGTPATGPATASAPTASAASAPGGCLLAPGAGNLSSTSDCTSCHTSYAAKHSHPVDVYQDGGRSRSLRTSAEVVRRGVFLSDGKVTCLSCHDGNSTWKYKIAMPPGAEPRPRVKPGNPLTYAPGMVVRAAMAMPSGSDVSPTPLCKACHAFD